MNAENPTLTEAVSPHPDIRVCAMTVEAGVMTVELDGQIRHQSVAGLQDFFFTKLTQWPASQLILDFGHIAFVDSQGLAFLIALYRFCNPKGCSIAIRNANAHVGNLIRMTRLTAFIKML